MTTWKTIARYLTGEATPEEHDNVEKLLRASQDKKRFIDLLRHFYRPSSIDFSPFQRESWNKIISRCKESDSKAVAISQLDVGVFIRIAASILIFISIGILGYLTWNLRKETFYVYNQSIDAIQEVKLPDGTKIFLNKNASLKVSSQYGEKYRRVKLEGEAFFDVYKNRSVPFEIETGELVIHVLGTSFNVQSGSDKNSNVTISVQEGKVGVRANKSVALLKQLVADQAVTYDVHRGFSEIASVDPNFLSWKTGIIRFKNRNLVEVCHVLSSYYKIDLKIKDPALSSLTITTELNNLSLVEALDVLEITLNLQIIKTGNTFYIQQ